MSWNSLVFLGAFVVSVAPLHYRCKRSITSRRSPVGCHEGHAILYNAKNNRTSVFFPSLQELDERLICTMGKREAVLVMPIGSGDCVVVDVLRPLHVPENFEIIRTFTTEMLTIVVEELSCELGIEVGYETEK